MIHNAMFARTQPNTFERPPQNNNLHMLVDLGKKKVLITQRNVIKSEEIKQQVSTKLPF